MSDKSHQTITSTIPDNYINLNDDDDDDDKDGMDIDPANPTQSSTLSADNHNNTPSPISVPSSKGEASASPDAVAELTLLSDQYKELLNTQQQILEEMQQKEADRTKLDMMLLMKQNVMEGVMSGVRASDTLYPCISINGHAVSFLLFTLIYIHRMIMRCIDGVLRRAQPLQVWGIHG